MLIFGKWLGIRLSEFIENRQNLIFIGPPGVGKTHLAIGIGTKAISAGFKVLFTSMLELNESAVQK